MPTITGIRPYKKGDYVQSKQSGSICICLEDQVSTIVSVECVVAASNTKLGSRFTKHFNNIIAIQYNGKWNINDSLPMPSFDWKTPKTFDPVDESISEEDDPFGLVKQRKALRDFLGG
jgi:hypothetical protein